MSGSTRKALALAGTSLGFGVVQLDVTVVNVAVPSIRGDLGASIDGAQWVVNAYTLVFATLILSAGALGDRLGARRVVLAGFALFTAASLACGLAPGLGWLIAFRAVQGVGAAALVPASLSVLTHAYDRPADRARAVGIWAAGASLGLSGGPLLGGALIAVADWRLVFLINLPLGAVGGLLVARHARETTRSPDISFDPTGQVLAVAALGLLAAATIEGGDLGFTDVRVLLGYALAAVSAVALVRVEARRRSPLLPLDLFGSRTFAACALTGLLVNIAFYGLIFVLGLYFQEVRGYTALVTGLAFAPATGAVLLTNLSAGRLVARFGTRTVVATSAAALVLALGGLLVAGAETPYLAVLAQLVVLGGALGAVVPAMTAGLLASAPKERAGTASGTLNTARQAGSVVGVALFGSFAATSVVHGLHAAAVVGAGLSVVVLVLALAFIGRTTGRAAT